MLDGPPIVEFGGFKTLPLYVLTGRTLEKIGPFAEGKVRVVYGDPDYAPPSYAVDRDYLKQSEVAGEFAANVVKAWQEHVGKFLYYTQFKNDEDRSRVSALHNHTELVSAICDARLGIDTALLWSVFDLCLNVETVQHSYRGDAEREQKYAEYAARLKDVWTSLPDRRRDAARLIHRIVRQIEIRGDGWREMPPLPGGTRSTPATVRPGRIQVFYSYSHRDESLRDQLENHLAILKRQGLIEGWHDRRIEPGTEWASQIDEHLEAAHIVLLLVSAEFIASDYCYAREMATAIARHQSGKARVIPVILRACDWTIAPFGAIQALPKDGKAITSWPNTDEAFTDVAKGIRKVVEELTSKG